MGKTSEWLSKGKKVVDEWNKGDKMLTDAPKPCQKSINEARK